MLSLLNVLGQWTPSQAKSLAFKLWLILFSLRPPQGSVHYSKVGSCILSFCPSDDRRRSYKHDSTQYTQYRISKRRHSDLLVPVEASAVENVSFHLIFVSVKIIILQRDIDRRNSETPGSRIRKPSRQHSDLFLQFQALTLILEIA